MRDAAPTAARGLVTCALRAVRLRGGLQGLWRSCSLWYVGAAGSRSPDGVQPRRSWIRIRRSCKADPVGAKGPPRLCKSIPPFRGPFAVRIPAQLRRQADRPGALQRRRAAPSPKKVTQRALGTRDAGSPPDAFIKRPSWPMYPFQEGWDCNAQPAGYACRNPPAALACKSFTHSGSQTLSLQAKAADPIAHACVYTQDRYVCNTAATIELRVKSRRRRKYRPGRGKSRTPRAVRSARPSTCRTSCLARYAANRRTQEHAPRLRSFAGRPRRNVRATAGRNGAGEASCRRR
jgi:hypothetical protein